MVLASHFFIDNKIFDDEKTTQNPIELRAQKCAKLGVEKGRIGILFDFSSSTAKSWGPGVRSRGFDTTSRVPM